MRIICFGSYLYEIDNDFNFIAWQPINDKGSSFSISAVYNRGKYLYFVLSGPKLLRIDTHLKTIDFLTSFG